MHKWVISALLFATLIALAFRTPDLPNRPLHNDEAVNGYKFGQLWETGSYKYDPNEHHGPSLYYATYALGKLTAAPDIAHFSETRLRIVTVLFGIGVILTLLLTVDGLGLRPTVWVGFLTALSPAMVFYSRYYIHEMILVFAAFLALASGWRYCRSRKLGWALLAGASVGLMAATKETFIISLIAAAIALGVNQAWNWWLDASRPPVKASPLRWAHIGLAALAGLGVAVVLFSSFFTNWSGPLDSVRTYGPWLNRAGGDSPHIHPWYFYLERLMFFHPGKGPVWSEAFLVGLAVVGGVAGFVRKKLGRANAGFVRFLALYTFALLAGYSIISYKTPWCMLSFLQPMILLAGVGAVVLLRSIRVRAARTLVFVLLLAGCGHLGWQAWALSFPYAADQRNPYVYAQTSVDIFRLVGKINGIAVVSPTTNQTVIKVMAPEDDFWPLPWYLRAYKNVGWWGALQNDPYAPMMIVSAQFHAALDEKKTHLMVGYFQLRPRVFFELYVDKQLWTDYLGKNPPASE